MKENKRGRFALVLSILLHIAILTALGRLLPDNEIAPVAMLEFELISTVQAAGHPSPVLETPVLHSPPANASVEQPNEKQPPLPDKKPVETVNPVSAKNNASTSSSNNNDVSFTQAAQTPGEGGSVGSGDNSGELGKGTAIAPPKSLKPPQLLHKVEPAYPEKARRENLEGKVIVRLEVAKNGSVAQATIEQSSGQQALDAAALAAVKKWRFVPARDTTDAPIRSFTTVPVVFRLN